MKKKKIPSLDSSLHKSLNAEQRQAVAPLEGVLVVRAGAGSGKTRVITSRIAHLLSSGVPGSSILALTFTNKAAHEMKERVRNLTAIPTGMPFVGTFHGFCLRTLRSQGWRLGLEQFCLVDDTDQKKLVKALLQATGAHRTVTVKTVLTAISLFKRNIQGTHLSAGGSGNRHQQLLLEMHRKYQEELERAHCLDFDDLLCYTVRLFEQHMPFREEFQATTRHLLVDEYQDTNTIQHELIKLIAQDPKKTTAHLGIDSLCVVGDEDQSIYSWRGATVTNMLRFDQDFKAKQITIEKNYRSVQPILDLANGIIQHNTLRNEKKLRSDRSATDRIRLLTCASDSQEAAAIATMLRELRRYHSLDSCAILYRSHFQSRALEEALIWHEIPYKIISGIAFYARQEIKDLLAYLRLMANPYDTIATARIINTPPRRLGKKFQERLFTLWQTEQKCSLPELLEHPVLEEFASPLQKTALKEIRDLITTYEPNSDAKTALNTVLSKTNYFAYIDREWDESDAQTRKENIRELMNSLSHFAPEAPSIIEFISHVALVESAAQDIDDTPSVKLMTIHAAKGLEFDTVIIPGLEEGVFPSTHSLYDSEKIEEERRLLYVALTRAREAVLITHAQHRTIFGSSGPQLASRFVDEYDPRYITHDNGIFWDAGQMTSYFSQWLTKSYSAQQGKKHTSSNTTKAQNPE